MKNLKLTAAFILCILLFQPLIYAQSKPGQIPVPFRVKDKFGVANTLGEMIIKPQFDWMVVSDFRQKFFTGYNVINGTVLSSLIYQNKILLLNQPYKSYYLKNGLFMAERFIITDEQNAYFNKRFVEKDDLFTVDGKKLINGNFTEISVMDGIDEEGLLNQTLVFTKDSAKRQSLFVYDRQLKKISKWYISNSNYVEINNNSTYNYKNRSYTIVFRDSTGTGHELLIVNDGKSLKLTSDKITTIATPRKQEMNTRAIDFPDMSKPFKSDSNANKDGNTATFNAYRIKSRSYYLPQQIEQLTNSIASPVGNNYLMIVNGKKGLKDINTGSIIAPAIYDDVIDPEFQGNKGGYILRSGRSYKVVFYDDNPITLPTVFKKIPLIISDYFGKNDPLIKLYDDNGRFFCYANASGKMYYREQ